MKIITTENIILMMLFTLSVILILLMVTFHGFDPSVELCIRKGWEGVHYISGEISGSVNCSALKEEYFTNDEWANKCSSSPFTTIPYCHTLCVESCKIKNKENPNQKCVC